MSKLKMKNVFCVRACKENFLHPHIDFFLGPVTVCISGGGADSIRRVVAFAAFSHDLDLSRIFQNLTGDVSAGGIASISLLTNKIFLTPVFGLATVCVSCGGHNGGEIGTSAEILYRPSDGYGVVVLMNAEGRNRTLEKVERAVLEAAATL